MRRILAAIRSSAVPFGTIVLTGTFPSGETGDAYSFTPSVSGGMGPIVLTYTGLPPGVVVLDAATGELGGTLSGGGTYQVTLTATDQAGQRARLRGTVTVVAPPLALSGTLAAATEGEAYSSGLTASDGLEPYAWDISVGTLPAGLSINSSTGVISGTPTETGSFPITVRVTDSSDPAQIETSEQTIEVAAITLDSLILAEPSLFGYWKLNETGSPAEYADSSGNGRDLGTIVATVTAGQDPLVGSDTSVLFNGTSGYIASGNNEFGTAIEAAFSGTGSTFNRPFTILCVVRTGSSIGEDIVFHVGNASVGGSQGFWLGIGSDGRWYVGNYTTGFISRYVLAGHAAATNTTYIIAARRTPIPGDGQAALFVNGVNRINTGAGISLGQYVQADDTSSSGGMRITIGAFYAASPSNFFGGRLQKLALFASAVSDAALLEMAEAAGLA